MKILVFFFRLLTEKNGGKIYIKNYFLAEIFAEKRNIQKIWGKLKTRDWGGEKRGVYRERQKREKIPREFPIFSARRQERKAPEESGRQKARKKHKKWNTRHEEPTQFPWDLRRVED